MKYSPEIETKILQAAEIAGIRDLFIGDCIPTAAAKIAADLGISRNLSHIIKHWVREFRLSAIKDDGIRSAIVDEICQMGGKFEVAHEVISKGRGLDYYAHRFTEVQLHAPSYRFSRKPGVAYGVGVTEPLGLPSYIVEALCPVLDSHDDYELGSLDPGELIALIP